ncbi:MAG TPA: GTP-binding protein, partial [Steroidobacteraceae bacterium]|nr:GTP-binding protein [Steroidobacteraceae bacterium]
MTAIEDRGVLRFFTAGSVDDGKSTLIGRLLYDTKSILSDQLTALARAGERRAAGRPELDLALLTDGLEAEREQGITIDVAYRYFATGRRKFIIADTPGHEQYTRNMVTGASTADAAVILIDATRVIHGVLLPQTRRHSALARLLGIQHIVVAVNKLDQVDFSESAFAIIVDAYTTLAERLGLPDVTAIPVSALYGDNVVTRSERTPWYQGPSLLEWLESVPSALEENQIVHAPLRFA